MCVKTLHDIHFETEGVIKMMKCLYKDMYLIPIVER